MHGCYYERDINGIIHVSLFVLCEVW